MMIATSNHTPTPSLTMVRALPHGVDELNQMGPFELFQTQLEHGLTEAKVDAMKRLSVVAFALGVEKTQSDLLPYLTTLSMKQPPLEDEILLIFASQLQLLVPNLLHHTAVLPLLPILERLAAIEETVVREEAVKAVNHVVPFLGPSVHLTQMAKRLAASDWFTSKVSAAGMCAILYETSRDDDLRYLYRDLCQDDAPMVRRAAAQHLGSFLGKLSFTQVQDLQPIIEQICSDEQDSVRLLAIAGLGKMGPQFPPEWTTQILLPILKSGSTDLSWRVRNNLAKSFSDVAISLNLNSNPELYQSQKALTMACFVSLLQDVEGEVRTSAVTHLAPMVHWGGPELFQSHLSPLLPALADDSVVDVRTKCALGIMDSMEGGTLADSTIVKTFGPLLENFLQDEYSEVQLHVLSNLSRISHLLHQLSGVVTTILNMAKASNWRVREGVAQLLPHLADARGMDFFSSVLLEPAWLALLLDPVCSVRTACVDGVAKLVRVAGEEWIVASLLPQHLKIYAHSESAYLMRMTILRAHAQMALASQRGNLFYQVVDFLCETGLKDKVSNVRMVTAKGLHLVCQSEESDPDVVQSKIRRAVEEQLAIEDDADCVYFMTECLQSC